MERLCGGLFKSRCKSEHCPWGENWLTSIKWQHKFCPVKGITIRKLCVWTLQERRLGGLSIIQTFSIFFDRGYNFHRNMKTIYNLTLVIRMKCVIWSAAKYLENDMH